MHASLTRTLLAGSLLATTINSCRFEQNNPPLAVVNPTPRAALSEPAAQPSPGLPKRGASDKPKVLLFEPPAVELPKPAQPVVQAAPARAPAPAYRFVGKFEQDGKSEYVLLKDGKAVPVVVGQILDEDY